MGMKRDENQVCIGTSKWDITQDKPLPLAGFAARTGLFESVSERLYMRILYLQQENAGSITGKSLLVSADFISWNEERMAALYDLLMHRYGLAASSILLNATHTHSGPQTNTRFLT